MASPGPKAKLSSPAKAPFVVGDWAHRAGGDKDRVLPPVDPDEPVPNVRPAKLAYHNAITPRHLNVKRQNPGPAGPVAWVNAQYKHRVKRTDEFCDCHLKGCKKCETMEAQRLERDMAALAAKLDAALDRCDDIEEKYRSPSLFPAPADVQPSQPTTLSMRSKLLYASPTPASPPPAVEERPAYPSVDLNPGGSLSGGLRAAALAPQFEGQRAELRSLMHDAATMDQLPLTHRERLQTGVLQLKGAMYGSPSRTLLSNYTN